MGPLSGESSAVPPPGTHRESGHQAAWGPVAVARLTAQLDEASFDVEMSREVRARLEETVRQLERELAVARSEASSLRTRLEERERFIQILRGSRGWKALQAVRRLFGRSW